MIGLIVLFSLLSIIVYMIIAYAFWLWPMSIGQMVVRIKGLVFSIHLTKNHPTLFVARAGSIHSRSLARFDLTSGTPEQFKTAVFEQIDHYLKRELSRQDRVKEFKRLKKFGTKMYMAEKFSKPL